MNKQFYSHLVEVDTLSVELDELKLESYERDELVELVHITIHHVVIDVVLTELNENEKKIFLQNLSNKNHKKILEHLRSIIENLEDKIKQASSSALEDLRRDIAEVKNHT